MTEELFKVNEEKIRLGLEELMKHRVNAILNHGGPFTLASAIDCYQETEQLTIRFGVNISEYNKKIKQYLEENFGKK